MRLVLAVWLVLVGVAPALAQLSLFSSKENIGVVMSAKEAHDKALTGDVVLVDVRSTAEWIETGLPASGFAITMHQNPEVFVQQLSDAMGGKKDRPLAVICATGSRTTYLQKALVKLGFSSPVNVAEGMIGGQHGTGWIKLGLPTRPWRSVQDLAPTMTGSQ